MLTLARVVAVPALVAAWFSSAPWSGAACTALFVGASLTDWLDGYLARKLVGWGEGCLYLETPSKHSKHMLQFNPLPRNRQSALNPAAPPPPPPCPPASECVVPLWRLP